MPKGISKLPPRARPRAKKPVACQRCHSRKVRCSGGIPCSNCQDASSCVYNQRDRQVTVQQSYIDKLVQENEKLRLRDQYHQTSSLPVAEIQVTDRDRSPPSRNPIVELTPWFTRTATSDEPIWIGEASDAAFATRFRKFAAKPEQVTCHIPRTHYATEELLSRLAASQPPWPSPSSAKLLVEACLRYLNNQYHIIRPSQIYEGLDNLYKNGFRAEDDPVFVYKIWAIFALGELFMARFASPLDGFPGATYFSSASAILQGISERPQLGVIETMMLLALYSLELNRRHSCSNIVGTLMQTATVMGLHLSTDDAYFPDLKVREHRSRIWWGAYVLNRTVCSMTGMPTSMADEDMSAPWPSRIDDPDFADHRSLVARIKLARISGRIMSTIYNRSELTGHFFVKVDNIMKECREWMESLPASFRIEDNLHENHSLSVSLRLLLNQCVILATRPVLLLVLQAKLNHSESSSRNTVPDSAINISQVCLSSARQTSALLKASWMEGSFKVFNYHYTRCLFSAATIQAASTLVDLGQRQPGLESFETADQFLRQLRDSGNFAASEFCAHMDCMRDRLKDHGMFEQASPSTGISSTAVETPLPHHDDAPLIPELSFIEAQVTGNSELGSWEAASFEELFDYRGFPNALFEV